MIPFTTPLPSLTYNGKLVPDGLLYIGTANTNPVTNPVTVYFDVAGTIVATQPLTVHDGYVMNGSNPATIYVAADCSFSMYDTQGRLLLTLPTTALAGAYVDTLRADLAATTGSGLVGYGLSTVSLALPQFHALKYGYVGFASDSRPAIQAAVDAAYAAGGGTVILPEGSILINGVASADGYLLNGVVLPVNTPHSISSPRVTLEGQGSSTILCAGTNGMVLVRNTGSRQGIKKVSFTQNGHTNVAGFMNAPIDIYDTATVSYQLYNTYEDIDLIQLEQGIVLAVGPTVAGTDSGGYYCQYRNIRGYATNIGIHELGFLPGAHGSAGRCLFENIRIGQFCNVGMWIRSGTSVFLHCNMEGISATSGTLYMPTGTALRNEGDNSFFGCHMEACTLDIYMKDSTYSEWHGGSYNPANCTFITRFRTIVTDSILTSGYIRGGSTDVSGSYAPLDILTPGGMRYQISSSGGNGEMSFLGGSGNTHGITSLNAGGSIALYNALLSEGDMISNIYGGGGSSAATNFYDHRTLGANAGATAMKIGKNTGTSRSINAGGTINASGADFAEYVFKAPGCGVIAKGAICGIDSNGMLTDKWAAAHTFVVKSTDPAYVGGDTWGTDLVLGVEPKAPSSELPHDDGKVDAAYTAAKSAYLAKYETARSGVDRVAFAGRVPVNVVGASVGDYIIPIANGTLIMGSCVKAPTLEQYLLSVGKVLSTTNNVVVILVKC